MFTDREGYHRGLRPLRQTPTPRQQQILDFISEAIETRGFPPSIDTVCREVQL